ncbi:MAG: M14 family metallopeptidase [Terriglobales bacterium]
MPKSLRLLVVCLALVSAGLAAIPTPSEYLKFTIGADRTLADYHQIQSYFETLAAASPRIKIEKLGKTTENNDLMMAVITSPENMKQLDRYKQIAHKLADPRGLSPQQIDELVQEGKLIVMVTCNIHSTEIASGQMAMEWAHALVTGSNPKTQKELNDIILLLVPSLNPDGQIMVTDWYRKYVGTKYEGGRMPWIYHHYTGHDNNRDWYMLTQKETQEVTKAAYLDWKPMVWLDEHQMGSLGPRLFVPPYTEPSSSNIDPLMWRGVNVIGTNMAWRLEQQQKSGVIYDYAYDAYWPGAVDGTAWWKNVFGLLTEAASARVASPIEIPPTELRGGTKGLIDYRVQTNYPNPWPGGRWGIREIMDYERIASDSLLETCLTHRDDFMRGVAAMAMTSSKLGAPDEYWKIGADQHDPYTAARLAFLMREQGVEVQTTMTADGRREYYIATYQPYGRYTNELFRTHRYPKIRAQAGGNVIPPYDTTTWSLPLMMDVNVQRVTLTKADEQKLSPVTDGDWPAGHVEGKGSVYAVLRNSNESAALLNELLKSKASVEVARDWFEVNRVSYPAGTLLISGVDIGPLASRYHVNADALTEKPRVATEKMSEPRIGLYRPWLASMDEGWTRYIFDQYHFNYKNLENKTIKAGKLRDNFDVIVIPAIEKSVIVDGKFKTEKEDMKYFEEFPPEYSGGIGKEGVTALKEFAENGGTIVTLAESGELLAEEFNIPVRNTLQDVKSDQFNCPGSILRVELDPKNPVNYGMPKYAKIFVDGNIAYQTTIPGGGMDREIIARYPADSEDALISGYLKGGERLENRAAAVSFSYGKGRLIMLGFRVQHRAQTEGTFKMLFNSIYWAGMQEPAQGGKAAGK